MSSDINPRVDAYLRQLNYALAPLPWEQRNEIFTDISAHIERELATAGTDPAAVEDVLRRMGDPQAIALEAGAMPAPPPRPGRTLEIWATALIAVGSFALPFIGWIVGVVLLWHSRRFRTSDKWIGTLLPPFGFFSPFALAFIPATWTTRVCGTDTRGGVVRQSCVTHGSAVHWLGVAALIVVLAAAIYTVSRLSRRIAQMG